MQAKYRAILTNYRKQKPTLAMIERETPCCASCAHVSIFTRKCHCNYIRGRQKNSVLGKESQVEYYAICDRYDDGKVISHGKALLGAVRGLRETRQEVGEQQVQDQHGGDSESQSELHSSGRSERPAATRLGEANPVRVPLVEANAPITITISR